MFEGVKDYQNGIKSFGQSRLKQMMINFASCSIKGNVLSKIISDQLQFLNDQIKLQHQFEVINIFYENNLHTQQQLFKKLFKKDFEIQGLQKTLSQDQQVTIDEDQQLKLIYRTIPRMKQDQLNLSIHKQSNNKKADQKQIFQLRSIVEYINQGATQMLQNNQLVQQPLSNKMVYQIHMTVHYLQQFSEAKELMNYQMYDEAIEICQRINFQNFYFLFLQAICCYRLKKYQHSIEICNQLQLMTKNDEKVLYLKGKSFLKIQDEIQAQLLFNEVININNKSFQAQYRLGLIYFKQQKYQKAIKCFDLRIEQNNQYMKSYFYKALSLYNIQEYIQAIIMFDRALEINPNHLESFVNKGLTLVKLRRFEEAIIMYDLALKINANSVESYVNKDKRLALRELRKFEEEIIMYDRALKIHPNNYESCFYKGNALDNLGEYEEAIIMYDLALKINANSVESYVSKGLSQRKLGKYEEAIITYDLALQINPNFTELYLIKEIHQLNQDYLKKQLQCTMRLYKQIQKIFKISVKVRVLDLFSGLALRELGKFEEEIIIYDRALKINPNDFESCFYKAVALDKLGKYEEAILMYDLVLKINPNSTESYINKGIALGKLRKFEEEIKMYDRSLKISSNYAETYVIKGIALAKLGKSQEAIILYDRALHMQVKEMHSSIQDNLKRQQQCMIRL